MNTNTKSPIVKFGLWFFGIFFALGVVLQIVEKLKSGEELQMMPLMILLFIFFIAAIIRILKEVDEKIPKVSIIKGIFLLILTYILFYASAYLFRNIELSQEMAIMFPRIVTSIFLLIASSIIYLRLKNTGLGIIKSFLYIFIPYIATIIVYYPETVANLFMVESEEAIFIFGMMFMPFISIITYILFFISIVFFFFPENYFNKEKSNHTGSNIVQ